MVSATIGHVTLSTINIVVEMESYLCSEFKVIMNIYDCGSMDVWLSLIFFYNNYIIDT
jgi:hypothetical protein